MSPLLEVTEDTPPDMLTGSMDLRLVLPDGKRVRMSVDRRTPMMDLLVQVTTAYKISTAGFVLQPYGESGLLPYKPSTPIGALDTWIVHIVPKTQSLQNPSNKINLKQVIPPFEQTFRFQVNLPRNQLYVSRVNGRCTMGELLKQACSEKNLDPTKYTLRHPKNLDKPLCEELSVAEYGHNQVSMVSHKSLPTAVSTEDILTKYKSLQSDSGSGSASGASSVSPVRPVQPSKPTRKRRPAPKPPVLDGQKPNQDNNIQHQTKGDSMICHSRTSSDSSGYHEASVLSESPDSNNSLPDSLPRRSKLPPAQNVVNNSAASRSKLSRSLSNLHQAVASTSGLKSAVSTSSLAPSRKKKPAPAPPVAIVEEREERSATLPPSARLVEHPSSPSLPSPVDRVGPVPVDSPSTRLSSPQPTEAELESARLDAEIERMFEQATREHVSLESGVELSREASPDWTWEYRLPAPPTFRDDITSPSLTDYSTVGNLKQILFEPLDDIKDNIIEEENEEFINNNNNIAKSINNCGSSNSINLKDNHVELNLKKLNGETLQENNDEDVEEVIENVHLIPNIIIEPKEVKHLKNCEKMYVAPDKVNGFDTVDIKSTPMVEDLSERPKISTEKHRDSVGISINNKNLIVSNSGGVQTFPKEDHFIEKVRTDSQMKKENQIEDNPKTVHKTRVERSDTVIQVVEQKAKSQNVIKTSQQEASNTRSAVLSELTSVINERGQNTNTTTNKMLRVEQKQEYVKKQERPQSMPLDNFCITTYSGSKPVEIYKEKSKNAKEISTSTSDSDSGKVSSLRDAAKLGSTKASGGAAVCRRSSARGDKRATSPLRVRRSASVVTSLQRRLQHSRSNGNLLEEDEFPGGYFRSNLRKTSSELSINIDPDESADILGKQETGLQSLQVLRSILPQLSQSQGALNTLETVNEKKEDFERPTISLTTWGERPKRQVSIKTDRDYVIGTKVQTLGAVSRPSPLPTPTRGSTSLEQQTVVREERKRTSVYKSIETGNTKPIRLNSADLGRLPVVRGVELKKNVQLNCSKEDLSHLSIHLVENKFQQEITDNRSQLSGNKLFNRGRLAENNNITIQNTTTNNNNKKETVPNGCSTERKRSIESVAVQPVDRTVKRQLETPTPTPPPPCPKESPPKYLFGCEARVKTRPPTLLPPKALDPRDELLASIRSFGKSTLKKVHQQR